VSSTEDRLRAALAARAEQIGPASLRPQAVPSGRPGKGWSGRRWAGPGLVLAAAAALVGIAVLGGMPLLRGASTDQLGVTAGRTTGGPSNGSSGGRSNQPSADPSNGPAAGLLNAPTGGPFGALCRADQLALAVLAESPWRQHSAGMNHHGLTVSLIDVSPTACRISGYLGIGMYDAGGRLVSADTVTRGGSQYADDPGPRPLLLAPGDAVFAELAWSSATGRTPEVAVTELRVIPPGSTVQLRTDLRTVLGADGRIAVTALTPYVPALLG
jgi:hypothetical protein